MKIENPSYADQHLKRTLQEPAKWYWTKEEKTKFKEGLRYFGRDWRKI